MKLSELVRYLNHLEQDSLPSGLSETMATASSLFHSVTSQSNSLPNFNDDLQLDFEKIQQSVSQFLGTVDTVKQHIRKLILENEDALYAQSQRLYEDEMVYETTEHILNRKLVADDEYITELSNRIKRHADWRWPGLMFRPALEDFIEDLVPLDPLYIVDQNLDLLQPAVEKFDPQYQRRIRQYVIDDRLPGEILKLLPNKQFGFIFANMFFNFKPLGVIKKYLEELYQKMRPGGVLIFTYNECNQWQGVDLAERNYMCYTPGGQIRDHAQSLGFVIERNVTTLPSVAWFELSKPGELESIRGGQSMAKIMPK